MDLNNCDNWRDITILSIPRKVFYRLFLKWIDGAIDLKFRREQAGFQKGGGCKDRVFALLNINEQCIEWNVPLFFNLTFKHSTVTRVFRRTFMGHIEYHPRLLSSPGNFVNTSNVLSSSRILGQSLPVKSGVRQCWIPSPVLFLVAINWAMHETTSDHPHGIQWTLFSHLEDLDFSDDLRVMSATLSRL